MSELSANSINLRSLLQRRIGFALLTLAFAVMVFSIQVKISPYQPNSRTGTTMAMKFASAENSGSLPNVKLKEFGKLLPARVLVLFALNTARIWALDRERCEKAVYRGLFTQKHYPFLYHRSATNSLVSGSVWLLQTIADESALRRVH